MKISIPLLEVKNNSFKKCAKNEIMHWILKFKLEECNKHAKDDVDIQIRQIEDESEALEKKKNI